MNILQRNQRRSMSFRFFLPALLLSVWLTAGIIASSAMAAALFTRDEAELLRYNDTEWKQMQEEEAYSATKGFMPDGPVIELVEPKVKNQDDVIMITPASLHLRFVSAGEAVNMSSLRVIGRKFLVKKDLTDRLAPYIKGQEVVARDLEIPSGKFTLDIEIADDKGAVTKQSYKVVVKG
ncbi:hypothetical protein VT99_10422 [Candidatus Electrothrix marina]|uniref:Uncharacterized protein n=1 Tax=Candidatus Electrothrix marina TaxID=1859130 RepID=A0A3S3QMV2_9BACT|nr:hypothetical protein VT99_10422 [Candidatus Electrothrix marina]